MSSVVAVVKQSLSSVLVVSQSHPAKSRISTPFVFRRAWNRTPSALRRGIWSLAGRIAYAPKRSNKLTYQH